MCAAQFGLCWPCLGFGQIEFEMLSYAKLDELGCVYILMSITSDPRVWGCRRIKFNEMNRTQQRKKCNHHHEHSSHNSHPLVRWIKPQNETYIVLNAGNIRNNCGLEWKRDFYRKMQRNNCTWWKCEKQKRARNEEYKTRIERVREWERRKKENANTMVSPNA